ncbi:A-kinase anchor protein 14 isoform X3 [Chrysemys picta bellii]|uniref:A-kinase anchor protein 14 isoform X3 n=1 Tax=Chrysemys picta bellii TaxID=8478 RepID=UPI0032B27DC3
MQKSICEICKKKREKLSTSSKTFNGPRARTLQWKEDSSKLRNTCHCTREWKSYSVVYVQQTWEFHESWLHWSDYLQEEELKYSRRYHYRVRWSIPTCRKPIPRATACIYFIIEISKIKPPTLPVEVFFILESNRLIHRPGQCRFREKWLKDIIESKRILMDSITF